MSFFQEGRKGLLFPFLPVSEAGTEDSGEEVFLADSPRELLTAHRFFPVPTITGFADCEGILTAGLEDSSVVGTKKKERKKKRVFSIFCF